ncbi:MAG: AsmA family protein [Rhodospirillales bacterium]|nr:AsmA family protein [Rhodospirillales bacterium]MDP6646657.1 AsmA family protein [Rhodospirillales bacterium]MDP6840932.1 AsmA family protein [Rhodospirillales bacterium]
MKKTLAILAGLLVALVAAALIVPGFLNWNQYRALIASEATAATGRAVEIGGDIRISLIPAPRLMIEDARLANIEGTSSADMATLKRLEVHVALAPLLSGAVRVQSVKLIEPVVRLEILEDGRNNFTFKPDKPGRRARSKPPPQISGRRPAGANGAIAPPAGDPRTSDPGAGAGEAGFAPAISIDNFTIERGRLEFLDAGKGRAETVDNLNGRFAMAALRGPWEASGSAVMRGIPFSFLGSTSAIVQNRTLPFNFDLTVIPGAVRSQFSGALTRLRDAPKVKGKIAVSGKNLDAFLSALAGVPASGGALARPFGIEANIVASEKEADISGIAVRFTETQMSGAMKLKTGKETEIDISLAANRLNLDAFLRAPPPVPGKPAARGAIPPPSSAKPVAARRPQARRSSGAKKDAKAGAALSLKALPENLNATVNLSVEAVTYRGQPVRQAKLNYALANREITLNQLSALLPGNTDIAAFGFIAEKDGALQFDGNLDAATSDLRQLLNWLDIDTDGVAGGRLRQFTLGTKLTARADAAHLKNFKLQFDGTTVTGSGSASLAGRPDMVADISVDRINLDSYLPNTAARKPAPKPAPTSPPRAQKPDAGAAVKSGAAKEAASEIKDQGAGALAKFDARLRARIKTLTYQGLPVRGIGADIALAKGDIRINKLQISDAAGVAANVSGSVSGLVSDMASGATAPELKEFKFNVTGKDLNRFFKLSGLKPPFPVQGFGALKLSGTASGKLDRINLRGKAEAFGGTLSMDGNIRALTGHGNFGPEIDAEFNLRHRDLARLMRNLGLDYRPNKGRIGGLALSGRLSGTPRKLKLAGLKGEAGGIPLKGAIGVDLSGPRPRLDARLNTGDIDIDKYLPAPKSAAGDGDLPLRRASLAPYFRRASWPGLGPGISDQRRRFIRAQSRISGRWSTDAIDLSGLGIVDGGAVIKSDSLKFGAYRLVNAEANAGLVGGTLNVAKLTGLIFGGEMRLDGSLAGKGREAQLVARYTLANIDAAAAQRAFGGRQISRGILNSAGEFGATGRSVAGLISSLRGRGTMALKGIGVASSGSGLSVLSGVGGLLRSINQFAGALGGKRSQGLADLTGAYTVNKGLVTFNDLSLVSNTVKGSVNGVVDLPAWRIKAEGRLDLAQNLVTQLLLKNTRTNTAIPFSVSGALDAPRVKLQTAKLPGGGIRLPGIDRLRKKKGVGKIIDQIFPGLKPPPPPPPPPPTTTTSQPLPQPPPQQPPPQRQPQPAQPKKPKVEDLLKDILRGLSR